ncbi:hypothetical protein [Actinomadura rudentiformis]|uniref:Secreted protein n=1 Tax=Actinomadura rudentiformis TaxID=359158 RepID=A0A6H9YA20_9ACTN|nr:hypothetical protein [Actinomadura rudentiformis]KAB2340527.1 hypothetical protein F8566_44095 [Actinomadura rudentiformis]
MNNYKMMWGCRSAALATLITTPLAAGALLLSPPAAHAAPAPEKQLLDTDTVSKADLKNPLSSLDVSAITKAVDKLATKNDLSSKTNIGAK